MQADTHFSKYPLGKPLEAKLLKVCQRPNGDYIAGQSGTAVILTVNSSREEVLFLCVL